MKRTATILCAISLSAYGIELFSVLFNLFGRQAIHPKVDGLNTFSAFLSNPGLSLTIITFLLIGLLAHLVLAASSSASAIAGKQLGLKPQTSLLLGILFIGLQLMLLRASNHVFFPQSLHDQPLPIPDHSLIPLLLLSISIGPIFLLGQYAIANKAKFTAAASTVAAVTLIFNTVGTNQALDLQQTAKQPPNIIILGVDSLRPDHMIGGLHHGVATTPFLDAQLKKSTWYRNAYTPAARTYPAWASILTGEYPKSHGVRFGLTPNERTKPSKSIAWELKENGYRTVYAMDERRFSYINQNWGFDTVVGPEAGAADFILGTLHDISVLNLLTLIPNSQTMLPYTANNRAIEALYDPARFAASTAQAIRHTPNDAPLFLATHLCLPHWPFGWKDQRAEYGWKDSAGRQQAYANAISQTDKQLQIIWSALEESGKLENSIVIFVSDHGEGHGLSEEHIASNQQIVDSTVQLDEITSTVGHGTNILALKQHEIVLAIQDRRTKEKTASTIITDPSSLLDIYPTIQEAIKSKPAPNKAVVTSLLNPASIASRGPDWHLFIESGFTVKALRKLNPKLSEVSNQSMSYYTLTENGELAIRDDIWPELIISKQKGILSADGSLLALTYHPVNKTTFYSYYDGATKTFQSNLDSFDHKTREMKELLYSHYQDEIIHPNWVTLSLSTEQ